MHQMRFFTTKAHNMIKCIIVICDDKLGQYWTGWEENAPLLIYNVSGWAEEKNPPMVMYNKRCWVLASDSRALSNLVRCIFWEAQYVWNVCAASFEMRNMFKMCALHLLRCTICLKCVCCIFGDAKCDGSVGCEMRNHNLLNSCSA